MMPDLSIESGFDGPVIGVDEAGRGPWAGPVTIAAAWLDQDTVAGFPPGLDDSKKMTAASRAAFHGILTQLPHHHVVLSVPVEVIDRDGILKATLAGMVRAAELLAKRLSEAGIGEAAQILIDGNQMPPLARPAQTVVKGDSRSLSIAAASVIAKHERDRIMQRLASENPGYGWEPIWVTARPPIARRWSVLASSGITAGASRPSGGYCATGPKHLPAKVNKFRPSARKGTELAPYPPQDNQPFWPLYTRCCECHDSAC